MVKGGCELEEALETEGSLKTAHFCVEVGKVVTPYG
jgi:hypothetical protein